MRNPSSLSLRRCLPLLAIPCSVLHSVPAAAQVPDSVRIAELERRIEIVTRELERIELGGDVVQADSSAGGFGPGASRVYRINQGVSLGGYGEVLYENYAAELENGAEGSKQDQFDALRAILYVGYKFNDRLLFNSEIEIEHAKEAFLEFAYLDYLLTDNVGIRGGVLLAPLGLVNELHEPPIFLGTERPLTERLIIPTTWRENGVGLFGGTDLFEWRAYLLSSFNGAGFTGSGLRGGRQKGGKAVSEDLGAAARLDYVGTPGLILGRCPRRDAIEDLGGAVSYVTQGLQTDCCRTPLLQRAHRGFHDGRRCAGAATDFGQIVNRITGFGCCVGKDVGDFAP